MLRQLVSYVQINCNNDMALLLGSGFQAMSTNRAQSALQNHIAAMAARGPYGDYGLNEPFAMLHRA